MRKNGRRMLSDREKLERKDQGVVRIWRVKSVETKSGS
jgi:hypothetical protein